jgi:hypothetical protein
LHVQPHPGRGEDAVAAGRLLALTPLFVYCYINMTLCRTDALTFFCSKAPLAGS